MFGQQVYPALEELKQPLSPKQLEILRNQVKAEDPMPSPQSLFNLAWGLIKSNIHKQQLEGIKILTKIYKDVPAMRRESLYYLSLGSYKVGDYTNARRYVEVLLDGEPDNAQAKALKDSIDDKVTRDGLIGLGIAGGLLAVGVGILGGVMRRKR
ncbi:mitochondrial fission 1 protein [Suhomyces tanzawaensis NRRL Y-17324]|uniref:Mitochondrial fission 1 protein n=1 Tax=Suhomyces tanzawaensis NRRL Y-17324 TaxID=984487 RepID=A0A1E4SPD4_9ASCO|nr:mitochondrial fission 1 protein [Suhomyces tanzawaensis NRRL Y-17324]ODV81277.1 mitochondrial fission 1 protein [Suhomyces tanzawaensis NRRL Y-17324]